MNVAGYPIGLGRLIALLVLIVVIILAVAGSALTRDWQLGLYAALALAMLLP